MASVDHSRAVIERRVDRLLERLPSAHPSEASDILEAAGDLRVAVRTQLLPTTQRELGQFLTPAPIAALAAAAGLQRAGGDVIDPACGDGSMLWAAYQRANWSQSRANIVGIDIDELLAKVALLPQGDWAPPTFPPIATLSGDAFLTVAGLAPAKRGFRQCFDAVLGNPPYVRYQEFAPLLARLNPALVQLFRTEFGDVTPSQLVDGIVRVSLLAHLLPTTDAGAVAKASGTLLRERPASLSQDEAQICWMRLVRGYSGLSDLSLPMWLLTWLVGREGSKIAYVTTSSPNSRDYGRILRYFMLRFLEPLLVIEQEGNRWFDGAQVTTALMVFRARLTRDVAVPLTDRQSTSGHIKVRIKRNWNVGEPGRLEDLARDLGGPDGPSVGMAADIVMEHILAGTQHPAWDRSEVSETEHIHALIAEEATARRSGVAIGPVLEMEGVRNSPTVSFSLKTSFEVPLPHALQALVPKHARFRSVADFGISVNQGLRTGANDFFYVRRVGETERTSHGDEPPQDHLLIETSQLLGRLRRYVPRRYIRPVARYQRSLGYWMLRPEGLDDHVFVTGLDRRPEDVSASSGRGGVLPDCVTELVNLGERASVARGKRRTRIPDLSAVRTNARTASPTSRQGISWWYTLGIAPRHYGPVLVPRVVTRRPGSFLNHPDEPALVDANFSTLTPNRNEFREKTLFALLNSTWVAATVELTATPMGGGALKVEAAHLRRLPLPALDAAAADKLSDLGTELGKLAVDDDESGAVLQRIDEVVAEAIAGSRGAEMFSAELQSVLATAAAARSRAT